MKADNISAITVFFDQNPTGGETSSEDELSSGFTTVAEEDGEDTPPDVPTPTGVPTLKRTKGFRIINFEELAIQMRSQEPNGYVEAATVIVASTTTALNSGLPLQSNGHLNGKRKMATIVPSLATNSKRCRTISEGGSPTGRQFVTDVSSKSLQSLKLDKEISEISVVSSEFP